ncbi:hypothetical protein LQ567_16855 [Niabella pedocola]|uniref:SurA N-terminal domain-containing protein n=1 Tax=Niabella pedocola TaxID=1752077 RepID=A0ABS8PTP3_9BACT|nr:hypothetical protein [Niabella pedocola]MCD2424452.1 hypothetical protein [Niabella pedocola]
MRKFVLTVAVLLFMGVVSYSQDSALTRVRTVMFAKADGTPQKSSITGVKSDMFSVVKVLSREDSIARDALDRKTDSLNLLRFKVDSVKSVKNGTLFTNEFVKQLGLKKGQVDSLHKINYRLEMDKNGAKATIADKGSLFKELALIERQRDVSYKEVLNEEQYKKYLSIKRVLLNSIYVQEAGKKKQ